MKTVFTARRLYTPVEEIEHPLLVVEDGRVSEISSLAESPLPCMPGWLISAKRSLLPAFSTFTFTVGQVSMSCSPRRLICRGSARFSRPMA